MRRLLKSQVYLLKFLGFLLLLGFISLGAIGGCNNKGGKEDGTRVLTEHDFGQDVGLIADPEKHLIVKFLEHPEHEPHENDTGGSGHDVIPHTYTRTVNHTFCWEDEDDNAEHFMVIEDSKGNEIVRLHVGDCVTETILEGDYEMKLHHDGRIDKNHPIFIKHGQDGDQAAKKDEIIPKGILARAEKVISKILQKMDIGITQTTNAQTLEDNINTLLLTNACPGCSLERADFNTADLRFANLSGADFNTADLRFANLSGADLNFAILINADLSGADLSSANLSNANLFFAILSDTNLSGADLNFAILINAILIGADLRNTNLSDANLSNADLSGADLNFAILFSADLSSANLTGADLSPANLTGADLINADLRDADLRGANLTGAYLIYADLRDADLRGADLTGANLFGSDFSGAFWIDGISICQQGSIGICILSPIPLEYYIDILLTTGICQICPLNGADLSGKNLEGVILSGSFLTGANLSGANLSNADLSGAILNVANLAGVNITGANLTGANLSKANLSNADLSGALLDNANMSESALQDANMSGASMVNVNLMNANLSGSVLDNANLTGAHMESSNLSGASIEGTILTGAVLSLATWVDGSTLCDQGSIGMCVAFDPF